MAMFDHYAEVDITKALQPETLNGVLTTFDNKANTFRTKLYNGGMPMSLVDYNVTGLFTGEDGVTWRIPGELVDGVAYVSLPVQCLAKPGRFSLAIKVGSGETESTIRLIRGHVVRTAEDDLWKTLKDFEGSPNGDGTVTLIITPYVDVKAYKVCRIVDGEVYTQYPVVQNRLEWTLTLSEGEYEFTCTPLLANRDGKMEEGNATTALFYVF